jgi:hypothetical protein
MRFLADECCDFSAVRALRAEGHDVLAVNEFQRRSVDKELMELALNEDRVGWLVFAGRVNSPGVILIRYPATARDLLAEAVVKLVRDHASRLPGGFVVLRPGSARISNRTS